MSTTNTAKPTPSTTQDSLISNTVLNELKREINLMLGFALNNGITINNEINNSLDSTKVVDLLNIHNILSKTIAPATPKSIAYLSHLDNVGITKKITTKLPLVRNLILLTLFFLILFIGTALSPEVNDYSLEKGIMKNNGISLLLNIVFLCSVSGLGVSFYLLKNVSISIQKGTLKPEESIYYSALIFLGIISGIILSEIISLYTDSTKNNLFNKSILALIGGFSSDAIFSILQSIIVKIKQLFSVNN